MKMTFDKENNEHLLTKNKFTENDVNLETDAIKELNKKITQNPIIINNGNQIREINRVM